MNKEPVYIIRPPQSKEEWNAVREMLLAYRNEFEDQTCFTSFEEEMQNLEGVYADPRKHKLIAVEHPGNKVVGCVGLRQLSPGVAEMKRLYVSPGYRGKRLGKKLAEEIIAIAKKMKFNRMVLDTMHEMVEAQKLYERMGFEVIEPYDLNDPRKVIYYGKNL